MTTKIIPSPIKMISNPSKRLKTQMGKAGISIKQLEQYINRSVHTPARGTKNSKSCKNTKNARKFENIANELFKEAFDHNVSTYIQYV